DLRGLGDAQAEGVGATAVGGDEERAAGRVDARQGARVALVHPAVVPARVARVHHAVGGGGDVQAAVPDQFGAGVDDVRPVGRGDVVSAVVQQGGGEAQPAARSCRLGQFRGALTGR